MSFSGGGEGGRNRKQKALEVLKANVGEDTSYRGGSVGGDNNSSSKIK